MSFQERSLRWEGRGPRPAWWLLYLIGVLVVTVVAVVEIFVDGAWLRETRSPTKGPDPSPGAGATLGA